MNTWTERAIKSLSDTAAFCARHEPHFIVDGATEAFRAYRRTRVRAEVAMEKLYRRQERRIAA